MTPEERLLRLENALSTLAELAKAQSERTENSERRIGLLIDLASTQHARIKECERQMEEIRQTLKEGAEAQKELREAQKQNEAHLAVLNSIVEELGRGQAEMQKAMTRLENSQASLNERFEQYISRRP
jgi:predicted nuclease with TOPRIM domain